MINSVNQKVSSGNIMPRMGKLEKELLFPEKEHWIFLTVTRKWNYFDDFKANKFYRILNFLVLHSYLLCTSWNFVFEHTVLSRCSCQHVFLHDFKEKWYFFPELTWHTMRKKSKWSRKSLVNQRMKAQNWLSLS